MLQTIKKIIPNTLTSCNLIAGCIATFHAFTGNVDIALLWIVIGATFDFFDGTTDLEEAVRRIQSNTRRYMRKQETWFKRDNTIKWFAPTEIKEIIKYIDNSLELEKE